MKKALLIVGIVILAVGVLSLAYAGLNCWMYYSVLDGSSSLYARLHQRMTIFLVIGIVLGLAAAACFVVRSKIQ